MKRTLPARLFLSALLLVLLSPLAAQSIITAPMYFDQVAANYRDLNDYVADLVLQVESERMEGQIYYKEPNLLRIDFTDPEEQVLVSDGSVLQIYVPRYDVTLNQALDPLSTTSPGGIATAQGLDLLRRNYTIAFLDSPNPVPLDNLEENPRGSSEPVVKLLLQWKNTNEGFREIELSIDSDQMIRRISGLTGDRRRVILTFTNIRTNQNIPDARFRYESPSSSNNFNNFLFGTN
ncbi:LolA family protein [Spirochaeta lutea]|nr:outer membrane lipoprotein carrier protein LolA [Spirochaeta lutea]